MNEVFYIKKFPGNAYRWVGDSDDMSLQTAPLFKDGSIDHEQWGEVSEMTEPRFMMWFAWMRGKYGGSGDD